MKLHRRDFLGSARGGLAVLADAHAAPRQCRGPHISNRFSPNCSPRPAASRIAGRISTTMAIRICSSASRRICRIVCIETIAASSSRWARDLKVADLPDTRAAAWGDFNADGNPDLYVGFTRRSGTANKLYRNDGHGKFVDVAKDLGVDVKGETRQISWIDFDNDGRVDLFRRISRRAQHAVS